MRKLLSNHLKNHTLTLLLLPLLLTKGIAQKKIKSLLPTIEEALVKYDLEGANKQLEAAFSLLPTVANPTVEGTLLLLQSKQQFAAGNYAAALSTIQEAEKIARGRGKTKLLVKVLISKGRYLVEWRSLEQAAITLTEASALYKFKQLKRKGLYASLQYHKGLLKIGQHQYEQADSIFTAVLKERDALEDKDLLRYQIQYQLAESKLEQEQFEVADSLLQAVRTAMDLRLGSDHYLMATVWNHLGRVADKKGKHDIAIAAYEQAVAIAANNQGTAHPVYGKILYNFGNAHLDAGDYEQAESLLLQAKKIYYATFQDTPRYAFMIAGLEELYRKLGQTERVLAYAIEQKNIFKQNSSLSDYARVVNNLSYIYQDKGQLDTANILLKNAIDDLVVAKKNTTGLYALLLMNYAGLNIDLGNFQVSEKYFEEAQQLLATIYGTTHPWYAAVINNLASLYGSTGKYESAKSLYLETEVIDRTTLGVKHPYYTHTQYKLASINWLLKDTSEAIQHYQIANAGQVDLIYNYYSSFDEATRLDYLKKTEEQFHRFFSFALDHSSAHPHLQTDVQNISLAIKNLALDFSANNQASANELKDTSLARIYQQYLAVKKSLSKNYILSAEELETAGIDLKELEEKAEFLEKDLIRNEVLSASKLSSQKTLTQEQLKDALADTETAIDIFHFPYYQADRKTDSTYYVASVNRKNWDTPKMIYLGEAKQLKKVLRPKIRRSGGNYIANTKVAKDLLDLIWQPLSPYLEGVTTISISPSGLLHKVSFAALPTGEKEYMIEKYRFQYHGNLRGRINSAENVQSDKSITVMGGANYDLDSLKLTKIAQALSEISSTKYDYSTILDSVDPIASVASDTSLRGGIVFNYLPGTKKEVEQIAQQFTANKLTVKAFIGASFLEENFNKQSGKQAPSILHIATHGYFFGPLKKGSKVPDNARGRIMAASNPLLRSGLALSGANYAWKEGKKIPNLEDGILTAYEIANQNLSNTNLVVLSACETALGDVVNGEGVFGLQRAFKMAGVNKMITSLWKVPDVQTTELMIVFYTSYLSSGNASDALHQAQMVLRAKYPPFYWASFIVVQ